MRVDEIEGITGFEAVRRNWDAVYESDDRAPIFLSWEWLRAHADASASTYVVLALRPETASQYVAFLPLALKVNTVRGIPLSRELQTAGSPLADYTGLLCQPDYETAAIAAFARYLQQRAGWEVLSLTDMPEDRCRQFTSHFSARRFQVATLATTRCPYITLPASWSAYLETRLGADAREKLRRYMRKVESLPGFRTTFANADNVGDLVKTLLDLYCARWGRDVLERRGIFEKLLLRCHDTNCLWLAMHQQDGVPIAGLAAFVDRQKNEFAYYMIGWNPNFAKLSPGRAVVGYSIRYAIEHGYSTYDFGKGDEPYKSSFCTQERLTRNVTIIRPGIRVSLQSATARWSKLRRTARRIVALYRRGEGLLRCLVDICRVRVHRTDVTLQNAVVPVGVSIELLSSEGSGLFTGQVSRELDLTEELCRKRLREGNFCVLARLHGQPAGMAWCSFSPVLAPQIDIYPVADSGYLFHLVVMPEARGKDIAPAMIRSVMNELSRRGMQRMWWILLGSNAPSIRAFKKVFPTSVPTAEAFVIRGLVSRVFVKTQDPEVRAFLGIARPHL